MDHSVSPGFTRHKPPPPQAHARDLPHPAPALDSAVRQGDADVSTEDRTRARRADDSSGRGERRREPAPAGRRPAARSGPAQIRPVSSVSAAATELPDEGLTARQRRILSCIREWVSEHGYPPSVREIGEVVGLVSPSSVAYQLKELEKKGYLRRDPNRPRAVDVRPPTDLSPEEDEALHASRPTPAYVPIPGDDATTLGRVVAVLRRICPLAGSDRWPDLTYWSRMSPKPSCWSE